MKVTNMKECKFRINSTIQKDLKVKGFCNTEEYRYEIGVDLYHGCYITRVKQSIIRSTEGGVFDPDNWEVMFIPDWM